MKLYLRNRVPAEYNLQSLQAIFSALETQINGISEGTMSASHSARTSAPTTGEYAVGDFVKNSTPSELGAASSKYIITGWICTTSPLTFKECRVLTGN